MSVRVILPTHLRVLANTTREVRLDVPAPVTARAIIDALEATYPALYATVRDPATQKRRPLVRFFACEEDFSHEPLDVVLPDKVARGEEAFHIIGAIAGG